MKIQFFPTSSEQRDFPPIPSKKAIPEWYKNLSNEFGEKTAEWMVKNSSETPYTIKKCPPVLDYITSGYVIRTQTEILLSTRQNENEQILSWKFASPDQSTVSYHPHNQCPVKIQNENKIYVKIGCGFVVKTPPGYSCLFYQSPYFMGNGLELFSAIVDTDTYDGEIFFPGFITTGFSDITIPPGTPLMTVFPFERKSWVAEVSKQVVPSGGKKFDKLRKIWISEVYRRFFQNDKSYK